jgi:hypothetical protein
MTTVGRHLHGRKENGGMKVGKVAFALVSVMCAGVMVWMAATAQRAQQRRIHALESEMKAMATRVQNDEAITRRAEWIQAQRSAPTGAPPPDSAVREQPLPEAPEVAPDPAVDPASEITSQEEYYAKVGVAFSAEPMDAAWARDTEYALRNTLSELAETSTVDSLECRQSLCKADVQHVDQEKFSAFIDRTIASARETWRGEITWYRDSVTSNGAVRSTMYFGKPGVSISHLAFAQ